MLARALLSVAVVAGLALAPSPARAEFEAGAYGGIHTFSDRNRLGRFDRDPASTSFSAAPTFGARFAYLPWSFLAAELQLGAVPTATQSGRSAVTVLHMRAHVIGTLPLGRFRPFVLFGAGTASALPADPVYLQRDTDLNIHAGVGLRVDVHKLWGLRLDVQTAAVPRTDRSGTAFDTGALLAWYGNFPWPPNPKPPFDKDDDGITDDKDECPDKAGEIQFGGCPDPDAPEDLEAAGEEGDAEKQEDSPEKQENAPAEPGKAAEPAGPGATTAPTAPPAPSATPAPKEAPK